MNFQYDPTAAKQQLDYKARFGGETPVTPVVFNPTAKQISEIKGIPLDSIGEVNYVNVNKEGVKTFTISLLCKFNPNALLKLQTPEYKDEVFVNYDIRCELGTNGVFSKSSPKCQVLDACNRSAWINYTAGQDLKAAVIEAKNKAKQNDQKRGVVELDEESVRIAMPGEAQLYQLIYSMANFPRYTKMSLSDAENPTPEQTTAAYMKILNGDLSALQAILDPNCSFANAFRSKGEMNKIVLLLGVYEKSGKYYQSVYSSKIQDSTQKASYKKSDLKATPSDAFVNYGPSYFSKSTIKNLFEPVTEANKYGGFATKNYFGETGEFKVIDLEMVPIGTATPTPTSTDSYGSAYSYVSETPGSDLPF